VKHTTGHRTDRGPKPENEDTILVLGLSEHPEVTILIVSDGMGGANAGAEASQTAVSVIRRELTSPRIPTSADAEDRIIEAIQEAHRAINRMASSHASLHGMGCTVVVAVIIDDTFWIGHVGDSRAYLVREDEIQQLTQDHSWVNSQIREGKMTEQQAASLQLGHVLDRALGIEGDVQVDIWPDDVLEEGDALVLCTDGLYGVVNQAEILRAATTLEPQEAADRLVALALAAPARDNLSAVILKHC